MLKAAANHYSIEGVSQTPESFDVDFINLILRDETIFRLDSIVSHIKITESIFRSASIVDIGIIDTMDLLDLLKIDGSETIEFKITRKEPGNSQKVLERSVVIAKIDQYSKERPGAMTYSFKCVPSYAYLNQYKTISKAVSGDFKNSIKGICTGDLGLNVKKDLEISKEGGQNFKAIIPIMKPISAIQWLLRNADDNGTPYYFFQTSDGKVHLKSKKELISKGVYSTYNNKPYFEYAKPLVDDSNEQKINYFNELREKISQDKSSINLSKYMTGAEGGYASTVHHIDIANKRKYEPQSFNSKFDNLLNKNVPVGTDTKISGQPISSLHSGKNYFISNNSLAFAGNEKNYHENASSESVAHMYSHKAIQDIISQSFMLMGDFDLHAGSIINLELLRTAELGEDFDRQLPFSDLLSGNHLVSSITHTFNHKRYSMNVEVKKDSFVSSLDKRRIKFDDE